jgi:hypothetical protein
MGGIYMTDKDLAKLTELQKGLLIKLEILDSTLRQPIDDYHAGMYETLSGVMDTASVDLCEIFLLLAKNKEHGFSQSQAKALADHAAAYHKRVPKRILDQLVAKK